MRSIPLTLAIAVLACTFPLQAGWFSNDEEVQQAKHVADLLREPTKLIAQAQAAFDKGDLEESIRLFAEARDQLREIEEQEDTTGTAFASLRLKKFHCISMLDALALQRANTQDRRQAVTNTEDLEARLAKERATVTEERAAAAKAKALPQPPDDAQLLAEAEAALAKAKPIAEDAANVLEKVKEEVRQATKAFEEAAKRNTAADAAAFLAQSEATKASAQTDGITKAQEAANQAQAEAREAQEALKTARAQLEDATARRKVAEINASRAQSEVSEATLRVQTLRQAIAEQKAREEKARKAQEALEAEELLKRQAEAQRLAAEQRARVEAAQAKQKAEDKAKAEADQKEKTAAIAWCEELWHLKRVDALEQRLTECAGKWPEQPEFIVLLAKLRLTQNRPDDALELVAMVPSEGDSGVQARLVAAGAYLVKNRPEEAMRVLEEAMKAAPNAPAPYFNMAVTLLRLPGVDPDRSLAAGYYTKSVELGGKRSSVIERRLGMEE